MARLSSVTSIPVDLQIVLSLVCLMAGFYTTAGQQTCSQKTQFIMHDPENPSVPVTCKNCPICPPGYGLPKECGDKVPYGTSTDCVPCKANKTYSTKNDSSTCKSCDYRENRIVSKECTPKQNRIYGDCIRGHYFEFGVDECKECFFCCPGVPESHHLQQCKDLGMPRHLQCKDTDKNKECKRQAPVPTRRMISSTSSIVATTSTADNSNNKKPTHGVNYKTQTIANSTRGSFDNNSIAPTDEHSKSLQQSAYTGIYMVCGLITTLFLFSIYKVVQHRRSSGEQGEAELPLRQFPAKDNFVNNMPNDNGRISTSSSLSPSTASSCTSSAENLIDTHKERLTHDISFIPEEQSLVDLPFDVEKSIKKLDYISRGVGNWRDVGHKFKIPDEDLDDLELEYKRGGSPIKGVMKILHTKYTTPLQKFVTVIREIQRKDVADEICFFYKTNQVLPPS